MNMEKINVNSMEYRKLSKEDKLKVVNFKINEILNDGDPKKNYVYYNGKKVGVPKEKAGVFRDLCDRKKSLEKVVSYSEVQPVDEIIDTTVKKSEIVDPITEEIAIIDDKIKEIKRLLNAIFNMYKLDEYKSNIIRINFRGESKFIPYSKLGSCKKLNSCLLSLEKKKRELESKRNSDVSEVIESQNKETENSIITNYEYYTDDGNPYESGYMLFPTKKSVEIASKPKSDAEIANLKNKNTELAVTTPSVKDLTVQDIEDNKNKKRKNNKNKKEKKNKNKKEKKFNKIFRKIATIPLIYGIVKGVNKFGKKIGNKFKSLWNTTKTKVNNLSEMLRKNKIKTAICALILAASTMVCSFLPRSNSKKHDTNSVIPPTSVSEITTNDDVETIIEEPTKPTEVEDKVVENEVVKNETKEEITGTKEYKLGENITLNNNSYIYTNSYDATSETNSCIPYYDNSYDREIVGVTYELDGQLYTIYKYDNDAINKVNELINKGAKQTAVLVVRSDFINTGDYEGYYNVDSVKIKVKTK